LMRTRCSTRTHRPTTSNRPANGAGKFTPLKRPRHLRPLHTRRLPTNTLKTRLHTLQPSLAHIPAQSLAPKVRSSSFRIPAPAVRASQPQRPSKVHEVDRSGARTPHPLAHTLRRAECNGRQQSARRAGGVTNPAPGHQAPGGTGSEIPMSHPRLLLADEDQITRTFLTDNLTADGYHVDTAKDRTQAIQRLRMTTPI
jgi:CheY-like chemotaxis protein